VLVPERGAELLNRRFIRIQPQNIRPQCSALWCNNYWHRILRSLALMKHQLILTPCNFCSLFDRWMFLKADRKRAEQGS